MKTLSTLSLAGAFAVLLASPALCGDLMITKEKHTDAFSMMGHDQPAKDTKQVMWIGKDRIRVEEGDTVSIVRADLKKLFILDTKAKTVSTLDLPLDMKKYMPPEASGMFDQMLG